ncbi:MAG: KamA family radical SAM protein [Deltaproteobacteria bacterium]|nr:KamA family radical SAM protein [Deltaproteobacteria bacterium]
MEKPRFVVDYDQYLQLLWDANPQLFELLKRQESLESARDAVYTYLEKAERDVFGLTNELHILEKSTVRESIRIFKSIIGPINEMRTEVSALDCLWKLACGRRAELQHDVTVAFIMEFINLFRGVSGKSNIYRENEEVKKGVPDFLRLQGREAALKRCEVLDDMAETMQKYFRRYPSGLDAEIIDWREQNRERILRYFEAPADAWYDYNWHLENVIKDPEDLFALIELPADYKDAVRKAARNNIPWGISPYYVSLMDRNASIGYDHALRAQVIPPPDYVEPMIKHRADRETIFDFMGEHDTSPADLITRRYPGICILKPYNTCPQICVYCQRNWEIDECLAPDALALSDTVEQALTWIEEHPAIGDVLITGGDPIVMSDERLEHLLSRLAGMKHVYRIRLGTRTPVTLPFRWTDELVATLANYHEPGRREIAVVTHFIHSYEVTPEARDAVQKIRRAGMSVYNQQVFTVENSRRFESAKLRCDLKSIGIDPYYTFNMKGKSETRRYMVPIARIQQERKEEARLLPGLDRTDEPVFNVPKLGKNHLRAVQDHRLVMIRPDGCRVYEFHPWEKNITPEPPYNYVDVPIYDYLEDLAARGESVADYRTIWFYY